LTLNTSAFAFSAFLSAPPVKIEYSRKSAKLVLVATPEIPLMDTWPPRVPSRNSRFR
jgi:hypothetical protein